MTTAAPPPRRTRTATPDAAGSSPAMLHHGGRGDGLAFSIAAIVIVLAFGFLIAKTAPMTRLDLRGDVALTRLHVGALGALGSAIYKAFSPAEAIGFAFVIVVVIGVVTRNLRLAATFAVVVAGTWVPSDIVKILVHRPRPDAGALSHHLASMPTDPSYPSGHMAFVTSLAVAFFFLSAGTRWRPVAIVVGIVAVVTVGFCLVSDGVHYPSDVLASLVWSLGVAPLVLAVCNRLAGARIARARSARARTARRGSSAAR